MKIPVLMEVFMKKNITILVTLLVSIFISFSSIAEEKVSDTEKNTVLNSDKELNEKVSLNNATEDQLISIPFIGPKKAMAIMKYREKKAFKNVREIMKIKGIGPKIYNKIKELIKI
jgi:competence protein ComEA